MKKLDKLRIPVIQGGMGIGISMGNLAGHVAKEGGMGVISTANIGFREEDFWTNPLEANKRALVAEIRKAKEISEGNGLVAINAMTVTSNFKDMVDLACESGIDAVICGAGLPLNLPEIVGDRDVLTAPIVSSHKAAKTIMNFWKRRSNRTPDFIVVEGSGAGGHLGFQAEEVLAESEQPLQEIVKEITGDSMFDGIPVFGAGGIFEKKDLDEIFDAGAYGVQIGTRFALTDEGDASDEYKEFMVSAACGETEIFKSPVGMPGRGVRTKLIEKVSGGERVAPERCVKCITTCNPKETPYCITKALIEAYYGNREEGLFFAGRNIGKIEQVVSVKSIMDQLAAEMEK